MSDKKSDMIKKMESERLFEGLSDPSLSWHSSAIDRVRERDYYIEEMAREILRLREENQRLEDKIEKGFNALADGLK